MPIITKAPIPPVPNPILDNPVVAAEVGAPPKNLVKGNVTPVAPSLPEPPLSLADIFYLGRGFT